MKSLAKKTGTKLAPRRNPTIYELFRNNKDSVENKDKSGIYIIPMMNLNINVRVHRNDNEIIRGKTAGT